MKNIVRATQRLISIFLVLVASSMVFLSSPAIAATSSLVTVNDKTFETEVIESSQSKPVITILYDSTYFQKRNLDYYVEELRAEAEKFYGNKYKIVTGKLEENNWLSSQGISVLPTLPPQTTIVAFKNSEIVNVSFVELGAELTRPFSQIEGEISRR